MVYQLLKKTKWIRTRLFQYLMTVKSWLSALSYSLINLNFSKQKFNYNTKISMLCDGTRKTSPLTELSQKHCKEQKPGCHRQWVHQAHCHDFRRVVAAFMHFEGGVNQASIIQPIVISLRSLVWQWIIGISQLAAMMSLRSFYQHFVWNEGKPE